MAARQGKTSKRKDSVRYVVTGPRESVPLSLSERLFDPAGLSFSRRLGAALIGGACLCAGTLVAAFGARERNGLAGFLGMFSILYGVGWARVAIAGRSPGGRLRLNPWGRG